MQPKIIGDKEKERLRTNLRRSFFYRGVYVSILTEISL